MSITSTLLQEYFAGSRRRAIYAESVRQYQALRIHALGESPHQLIAERRPHESEEIHRYRLRIYEPVTRQAFNRVLQSLGKIRRSPDWMVRYPAHSFPRISPTESLDHYCETRFPDYGSVSAWAFAAWLPATMMDAHAVALVMPRSLPTHSAAYIEPVPIIFHADQVIELIPDILAILRCDTPATIVREGSTYRYEQYYVVTPQHIALYRSDGEAYHVVPESVIAHVLGYLPIVTARGQYTHSVQGAPVYESRLAPMLPAMNEAVREYSDLQAAVVCHLFPERWEMATQECHSCKGIGRVNSSDSTDGTPRQIICASCQGVGMLAATSPYRRTVIKPVKVNTGDQPVPIPPFDYVKKDIEVVRVMEERIERHLYRALAAVNMQYLAERPLATSGAAKALDRDELHNFVYQVAEDVITAMRQLYGIIADYRYRVLYPDPADRLRMLPTVPVPQVYELLNTGYYMDEVAKAKSSNMNGAVVSTLEYEFAARRFAAQPELCHRLAAALALDPLPGLSEQDKMTRLTNGGISRIDYIVSCNIVSFIARAVGADSGFVSLPYMQAMEIVRGYAGEMG